MNIKINGLILFFGSKRVARPDKKGRTRKNTFFARLASLPPASFGHSGV
ncbi:hypothetical protein FM107_13500 [Sphingobacterium sp. JB170]|nr:hypothetical protein FM107_13500 [Sphingobacterium sp. JB170]